MLSKLKNHCHCASPTLPWLSCPILGGRNYAKVTAVPPHLPGAGSFSLTVLKSGPLFLLRNATISLSVPLQEVVCFNAKLKILEHRQQRIAEVRAKYEWLMKELEATKQYLMLDPNKWLRECKAQAQGDTDPGGLTW